MKSILFIFLTLITGNLLAQTNFLNSVSVYPSGWTTGAGTPGVLQLRADAASPSNSITYGTDGTGWGFSIAKNHANVRTNQLTLMDYGNWYLNNNTGSTLYYEAYHDKIRFASSMWGSLIKSADVDVYN